MVQIKASTATWADVGPATGKSWWKKFGWCQGAQSSSVLTKNAYNHMVEISGVSNIKCWYPHIWTSIPLPVLVGFIWCRWTTTQTATLRGNGNRIDPMSWLLQRLAWRPSQIGSADFLHQQTTTSGDFNWMFHLGPKNAGIFKLFYEDV